MSESTIDLFPVWLSLKVATLATLFLILPGVLLAWLLSRPVRRPGAWRSGLRIVVATLVNLPLVLPPTVVGFVLLLLLGRGTAFGRALNSIGISYLFTEQGAMLAALVMALPLFVRTLGASFASVDADLLEAGRTLGAREAQLLWRIVLPMSFRGFVAATLLAWARAFGEFGATLMVAGNIARETQTLPLALYSRVESGDFNGAWVYALIAVAATGGAILLTETTTTRIARARAEL